MHNKMFSLEKEVGPGKREQGGEMGKQGVNSARTDESGSI